MWGRRCVDLWRAGVQQVLCICWELWSNVRWRCTKTCVFASFIARGHLVELGVEMLGVLADLQVEEKDLGLVESVCWRRHGMLAWK